MFDFGKFNTSFESKFNKQVDCDTYIKISEMGDNVFTVYGMFINPNGKFGEHGCLQIEKADCRVWVSLPAGLNDTINSIMNDDNAIEAVNAGLCGVKARSYFSKKYNRTCWTVDFVNID